MSSSKNRNPAKAAPETDVTADLPPVAAAAIADLPPVNAPRFQMVVDENDNDEALDAIRHRTVANPAYADAVAGLAALETEDTIRQRIEDEYRAQAVSLQAPVAADPDAGFLYVMDRSATHRSGAREHELILADGEIRPFVFEAFKPTKLAFEIGMRFLKSEGFVLTDSTGQVLPFKKLPKRPEELEAGERLKVELDETIARYDELTDRALAMRVAQLPGSEVVVRRGDRDQMIRFIIEFYQVKARQNSRRENLNIDDLEGFTPAPETGDF